MPAMYPDPDTEFREEVEYRAKVYNLLSNGLSTTEIERLLARRIDWSLFSEATVKSMANSKKPAVVINIPDFEKMLSSKLDKVLNSKSVKSQPTLDLAPVFKKFELLIHLWSAVIFIMFCLTILVMFK